MIILEEVSKIYNPNTTAQCIALKNINLMVNKGEMVAVQGRSGSGKSTLLNIIGCIDNLSSGKYLLNGVDVTKMNDKKLSKIRNKYFGFVMQDFGLILGNKVIDNVALPLYFGKEKFRNVKNLSEAALEKVGMLSYKNKKASQLSGGQKQRVTIARALVTDPDVILADEPTGALDSNTAADIMSLLKELNRSGKTVIIVTHDDKVVTYCERVIRLSDGEIVQESDAKQVLG